MDIVAPSDGQCQGQIPPPAGHGMRPQTRVILAAVIYTLLYSFFCIQRWNTGYLGDVDYGLFNQSFWTTAKQSWLFYNTYEGGSHFRTHNSPIFYLLLPLYVVFPAVQTLLICQVAAVALGGIAVYKLAALLLDENCGFTCALIYFLYHPLHGVTYDQFNELAFLLAPLLFAFYHLYRRNMGWFWICILFALGCKEDVPFVTGAMGIYIVGLAVLCGRREGRRHPLLAHGVALVLLSAVWLWFSLCVLFPHLRAGQDWPYFKDRYGHLGDSLGSVVLTLLTHPWIALRYLLSRQAVLVSLELVLPLALLPLLAPRVLLIAAPTWLTLQLSSADAPGMHNAASRYIAPIVACLMVSLVVGVRQCVTYGTPVPSRRNPWRFLQWWMGLQRRPSDLDPVALPAQQQAHARRILRWPLVLSLLFALAIDTTPMRVPFKNIPWMNAHMRARNSLIALIPPDASVSTQPDFFGHVTSRPEAYLGYRPGVDYILVDPTSQLWFNRNYPDGHGGHTNWAQCLPDLLNSRQYEVVKEADHALLLRRSSPPVRR